MSCATCHDPAQGFSNGRAVAQGITGALGSRNVPTIYAAAAQTLTFWDGRASSLEQQALLPIENPVEMNESLDNAVAKLAADPSYVEAFFEAFNSAPNAQDLARAIASFERALVLEPTPVARFRQGQTNALTPAQARGLNLFNSPRTACATCHSGPNFSDQGFHNIGIGINGPNPDLGRFGVTGFARDRGAFKTPTLLNIARSAPYMHDGSLSSLQQVVAHYNRGGNLNANLDPRIRPLNLTAGEQADLVAFLQALSANDNLASLQAGF